MVLIPICWMLMFVDFCSMICLSMVRSCVFGTLPFASSQIIVLFRCDCREVQQSTGIDGAAKSFQAKLPMISLGCVRGNVQKPNAEYIKPT